MKKMMNRLKDRKRGRQSGAAALLAVGGVKRPPYGRMKKILRLLHEGRYPNCTTIAAEMEVSVKTANRDLEFMRDTLELPLEYDDKRHGFHLTKPVEGFPLVPVTAEELFSVCVAHQAIEHYRGTPLEKPLEMAFKKLAAQLDDDERFTLQSLEEVLSFKPFAPEDADLKLFEVVTRAVARRVAMRFQYRKPGEKRADARHVHPYHLFEFGHRWYLLAHDLGRDDIRTFVLGRMREVAVTEDHFRVPKDFDPRRYLDKSLGVMSGKGDYEVVIDMDAWLTDILRGRRWHPSQVVTERPGGGSQLRMRLSGLEEIEQYVLSWGTHATVTGPQALRERVGRVARAVGGRY